MSFRPRWRSEILRMYKRRIVFENLNAAVASFAELGLSARGAR